MWNNSFTWLKTKFIKHHCDSLGLPKPVSQLMFKISSLYSRLYNLFAVRVTWKVRKMIWETAAAHVVNIDWTVEDHRENMQIVKVSCKPL